MCVCGVIIIGSIVGTYYNWLTDKSPKLTKEERAELPPSQYYGMVGIMALIMLGLTVALLTSMGLDNVADTLGIKTDLGYTVCGEVFYGGGSVEECSSSTTAGDFLRLLSLAFGWCAAYGVHTLINERLKKRYAEWRQWAESNRQPPPTT